MQSSHQHFQAAPPTCRRTRRYLTQLGFSLAVAIVTLALLIVASVGADIG